MKIHPRLALVFLGFGFAGVTAFGGCKSSDTLALVSDPIHADFTCSDMPATTGTADITGILSCDYSAQSKTLVVELDGGPNERLRLTLLDVSGTGTFKTDGGDIDKNFVAVTGTAGMEHPNLFSGDLDSCVDNDCSIEITDADVISAGPNAKGNLSLTIDCPKLTAQSSSCLTCVVTPGKWTIDIEGCANNE